jgi:hypothetical protein
LIYPELTPPTNFSDRNSRTVGQMRAYLCFLEREHNIGDSVLKKDIRIRDNHKFSSPWEGPFIIVDIATPGAYVLAEVDDSMLPNSWNAD